MRMVDLIEKKRDGGILTDDEIRFIIKGFTDGSIPDYQMSAFAMTVFYKGMTDHETAVLTDAMMRSGDTVDLSRFGDKSVDKHSTGGVGDKTTLIVAPIVSSLGGKMAKMSGRGLGHTGGTVDKLESIPGYQTTLSAEAFMQQVEDVGVAVIGQSGNLTPADKKLYALRDVTATIDSLPLITSSIMSKKLAAGAHSIVLDVKIGSGAFMKTLEDGQKLAESMVRIGRACGRNVVAVMSNMDIPLGFYIGNALEVREADSWRGVTSSGMEDVQDFTAFLTRKKTFRDHLTEQIGQMKLVDDELLRLCRFLIDCLNERGYLDCPLAELSREFDIPLFSLEQALFAVQMLDPPGVGARNLSECLTLQLAQGRSLDPLALKIARDGLELLGKRDFSGLATLLGVSVGEARAAAAKILALNPIPSRSFADSEQIAYVAPDAEFSVQQGQLVIELNERILPRLSVNAEYAALMNTSDDPEVQRYVKEKLSEAQALIKGVHTRCDTLVQMLTLIGREQHGFFCGGEALLPVTMQQLSEKMGVSTSTVSRAAQNKYIQFQGRIIPVRSFFTTAIRPDAAVSSHAVKQRLQNLIRAEDPAAPLSDEALRLTLSALGIEVSRRAVAKYRAEMDIPSSSQRKKR